MFGLSKHVGNLLTVGRDEIGDNPTLKTLTSSNESCDFQWLTLQLTTLPRAFGDFTSRPDITVKLRVIFVRLPSLFLDS